MIKGIEEGDDDDATEFLTQELLEITPDELHGMSTAERAQGKYCCGEWANKIK